MLHYIRRWQKGLLIVVSAIIIVAFAWLYNSLDYDQPTMQEAFRLGDRKYRVSEAQKLFRTYNMGLQLGLYEYTMTMRGRGATGQGGDETDYAINVLLLRQQAEKMGVQPSQEEIAAYIKEMPTFRSGGSYDATRYTTFVQDLMVPNGFSELDLFQIVGDAIKFNKLQDLVGSNAAPAQSVVDERYEADYTLVKAARLDLPKDRYQVDDSVSDEEVATFYEANKAGLLSDQKRTIEYVQFTEPVKAEGQSDEDHAAAVKAYGESVAVFAEAVLAEGADFAKEAKSRNLDLKRSGPFTANEPPEALAESRELVGAVFSPTRSLNQPIGEPVATADGYYLYNLLAIDEPSPLTLEEATPKIRERLASMAAMTKVNAAAGADREKVLAALKSGKSFADAAKELGLEAKQVPEFSRARPPAGEPDANVILSTAAALEPGDLSEIIPGSEDNLMLLYVEDKSLLEDETSPAIKEDIKGRLAGVDGRLLFQAWFDEARNQAGASRPAAAQ